MELASPEAELPAAVVAAAAAAEISDPSALVWDSLIILTEVPLFMHISASGSGAEAEKVISAHLLGCQLRLRMGEWDSRKKESEGG